MEAELAGRTGLRYADPRLVIRQVVKLVPKLLPADILLSPFPGPEGQGRTYEEVMIEAFIEQYEERYTFMQPNTCAAQVGTPFLSTSVSGRCSQGFIQCPAIFHQLHMSCHVFPRHIPPATYVMPWVWSSIITRVG
jgi:hypothetical protein